MLFLIVKYNLHNPISLENVTILQSDFAWIHTMCFIHKNISNNNINHKDRPLNLNISGE